MVQCGGLSYRELRVPHHDSTRDAGYCRDQHVPHHDLTRDAGDRAQLKRVFGWILELLFNARDYLVISLRDSPPNRNLN
jgi:hypothetical protein